MGRWPRFTISRLMIGIVALALALVFWAMIFAPMAVLIIVLFLIVTLTPYLSSRPSHPGVRARPRRRASNRFRFSIWQIMVVVAFAANCSIMARASLVGGIMAFVLFCATFLGIAALARGAQRL